MKQTRSKFFGTNIGTIPEKTPTNFEPKRLKPKLDNVEKPENRVHKLTDSNGHLGLPLKVRVRFKVRVMQSKGSDPIIGVSDYRQDFPDPRTLPIIGHFHVTTMRCNITALSSRDLQPLMCTQL